MTWQPVIRSARCPNRSFAARQRQQTWFWLKQTAPAGCPFKAPGEREPVPHEKSNRIFIIAGLSALGLPVCRACHRPKLVCEITGRPETSVLTTRDMACVLYHGYIRPMRLKFPGAPLTVLLNQADGPERQEAGRDAGCRLKSLLGSGEAPVEIWLNSWAGPLKGERL